MKGIWKQIWQVSIVLLAAAALSFADTANTPPGTLNYVEGQVSVQGQVQTPKSVGSTLVGPDQKLQTRDGNAEMLLTPGVYLRVGHHSSVTMLAPDLANTQVELTKGSAMLEVDELFEQNNLSFVMDNSRTRIKKQGLYDFTANPGSVKVLQGEAEVSEGDRQINLKKGHEALLAQGQPPMKQKFNKHQFENDALYRWSMLRSEYASEANVNEGNALLGAGGWWGPGWYWDPFWMDFAFMPGWGMGWGPFGYPFFSPWMVGWAPYYGVTGYGHRYGLYNYPVNRAATRPLPPLAHGVARGSAGFQPFPRSMTGNRMGMRAGGFHAGGFGGGFRGGFRGGFGTGFHGGSFHGRG